MKILVTGAAGFIGYHLIESLLSLFKINPTTNIIVNIDDQHA